MARNALTDESTAIGRERGGGEGPGRPVPALTILSHRAAGRAGERAVLRSLAVGREAALSRAAPDFVRPGAALGQPLADPFLSRKPVRLLPGRAGGARVVADPEGTPLLVDGRPCEDRSLRVEDLARGVTLELAGRVALLLHLTQPGLGRCERGLGMIGESDGIHQVRRDIEQILDLTVPVLVRGETGTGKELVARALHEHGTRRTGPFVSVNLGAIPRELAASELFGARRGAYTGAARDREGFFRAARGGTLFLDEIGEAPPEVQVMLLRVLETGEMFPVGDDSPVRTDVRLIAATDANLEEHIRSGRFRAPLLHRLAGYEIRLPPLRERPEDIGLLFHRFAAEELAAIGEAHRLDASDPRADPWLPASIAARLARAPWPGNIRQLRNVARQIVIGSRGKPALEAPARLLDELGEREELISERRPVTPVPSQEESGVKVRRRAFEVPEAELLSALRESAWDLAAAADRLGIARSSIYDAIERCPGIRTAGALSAEEIARAYRECGGDLDAMVQRLEVSARALKRRLKELGLGVRRA